MTVSAEFVVRVWVTDVWDMVRLKVSPEWTVARLKQAALEQATGRRPDSSRYTVKYRGAPVLDDSQTLAELRAPDKAAFIVLPKKRQPVR